MDTDLDRAVDTWHRLTVRLEPVPGHPAGEVLPVLQRFDPSTPEAFEAHVRKYGVALPLGLVTDQSAHRRARTLGMRLAREEASSQVVASSYRALVEVGAFDDFERAMDSLRRDLDRLIGGEAPQEFRWKADIVPTRISSGDLVLIVATETHPFTRARLEAFSAYAPERGRAIAKCRYCDRFFVPRRGGERYANYCPAPFDCAERAYGKEYAQTDYRREYMRLHKRLQRLRHRDATPKQIREAERDIENLKRSEDWRKK